MSGPACTLTPVSCRQPGRFLHRTATLILGTTLAVLSVFAGNEVCSADNSRAPNILLIMADDLGYGDVGWLGGRYKTPHLDRLAESSVRLLQHYSLPVCSPTRSSLLSGRFNSRFGCTNPTNNRVFPFDTVTVGSALASLGYDTALIGKWHLGSKPEWGPQHYGFGTSYGSLAGGVTSYSHIYKTGPFAQTWHRNGDLIEDEGHVTDLITREAVAFIEKPRESPFFLYVPYTAVHLPVEEPDAWQKLYGDESEPGVRQYGACVSHMDDGVGRMLAALDAKGLRESTLIVFISDNGGSIGTQNNDPQYAGTHPTFRIPSSNGVLRDRKGSVYEGGIRTPGLVAWAGVLTPRDEQTPVHVADWFLTFAAVAGYRPQVDLKWDGTNIWPMLTGAQTAQPRPLYWLGPGSRSSALRHGDLVLIRHRDKPDELYDLAADISQKRDLASERPEDVQRLAALLQTLSARDNDARVE